MNKKFIIFLSLFIALVLGLGIWGLATGLFKSSATGAGNLHYWGKAESNITNCTFGPDSGGEVHRYTALPATQTNFDGRSDVSSLTHSWDHYNVSTGNKYFQAVSVCMTNLGFTPLKAFGKTYYSQGTCYSNFYGPYSRGGDVGTLTLTSYRALVVVKVRENYCTPGVTGTYECVRDSVGALVKDQTTGVSAKTGTGGIALLYLSPGAHSLTASKSGYNNSSARAVDVAKDRCLGQSTSLLLPRQ